MYLFAQICKDDESIPFVQSCSSRTQGEPLPTGVFSQGNAPGNAYVPAGIAGSQ